MTASRPPPLAAQAIVWYRRETFAAVRAAMTDADRLPATYEKWRDAALKGEEKLRRAGFAVIRVDLDLDEFTAFCRERNPHLDGAARTQFAAFVAARMVQDKARGNA